MILTNYVRQRIGLLLFFVALSGCGAPTHGAVAIWIDSPSPGGSVMSGEIVTIQTHAYASAGIAEIELAVDGKPLTRNVPSPAGADLVSLEQTWVATTPGMHTIQVTGYSAEKMMSNPRVVVIEVVGIQTETAIPSTAAPPTPTQTTVPPTLTTTSFVTSTPTNQPTLTPSLTSTPTLPLEIIFTADKDSLEVGNCTFLRWQVENAQAVTLDGTMVTSLDARKVCPVKTTTYTLQASSIGQEEWKTITIQVTMPVVKDTTSPLITNLSINPKLIYDNPSCGVNKTKVMATIQDDASGVERVEIFYQVVTSESGKMISSTMNGNEKEGFYFYLGDEELSRSLVLYGGGTVRFYIIAEDKDGNTTRSKTYTFKTEACLL